MSHATDVQVCNNCHYIVLGAKHKIKCCVACDGAGEMYIDNETPFHILMDRLEEYSYRRSCVEQIEEEK